MTEKANSGGVIVKLKNVRLSFPHLFDRDTFRRYSAVFIVEPGSENDKAIRAAIRQVATEKWKDKAEATLKQIKENSAKDICYRDGNSRTTDDGEIMDGFADKWALSATSKVQPTLVNERRQPVTSDDGKLYAGCYVNAIVQIWAQDGQVRDRDKGTTLRVRGIRCQLQGVQHAGEGESLGGGRRASADEFDEVPVNVDEDSSNEFSEDDLI